MNLKFYKQGTFNEIPEGSLLFNTDTQKIYLKEGDKYVCYSTELIPVKVLESYIGFGTTAGAAQTVTLDNSKFYIIGRCSSLTINLPTGSDTNCQEYSCQFYVPNDSFTLKLPDSVRFQNGLAPVFEENSCVQLVICNNGASYGIFK